MADLSFILFGLSCFCLCWMNNTLTCLVKSKPVKQEVSRTVIFPHKVSVLWTISPIQRSVARPYLSTISTIQRIKALKVATTDILTVHQFYKLVMANWFFHWKRGLFKKRIHLWKLDCSMGSVNRPLTINRFMCPIDQ